MISVAEVLYCILLLQQNPVLTGDILSLQQPQVVYASCLAGQDSLR